MSTSVSIRFNHVPRFWIESLSQKFPKTFFAEDSLSLRMTPGHVPPALQCVQPQLEVTPPLVSVPAFSPRIPQGWGQIVSCLAKISSSLLPSDSSTYEVEA